MKAIETSSTATTNAFTSEELRAFFHPRGIAVVGASEDTSKPGGRSLANLRAAYQGELFAVHPTRETVQGVRAFSSVKDLPETADMALLFVSAEDAAPTMHDLGETQVRSAIVFAAGFNETGNDALLDDLVRAARSAGVRLLGPNCAGVFDYHRRYQMGFSPGFAPHTWRPGRIGLAIQGGGLARSLSQGEERAEGFSWLISLGNEADMQVGDGIRFLAEDPNTSVIAILIEGVRDGRRFREGLRVAQQRGKPVVALKVGRTGQGAEAAGLHTGALTGDDRIFTAAMRDLGVRVACDLDDFYGLASTLARWGEPTSSGLAVATFSGGAASLCADIAELEGVTLDPLDPGLRGRLSEIVPEFANIANPLDLTGAVYARPQMLAESVQCLAESGRFGVIVVAVPMHYTVLMDGVAVELALLQRRIEVPIVAVWLSQGRPPSSMLILEDAGIHVFTSATSTMRAMGGFLRRPQGRPSLVAAKTPEDGELELPEPYFDDGVLRESEVAELVSAHGIGIAPYTVLYAGEGRPTPEFAPVTVPSAGMAVKLEREGHLHKNQVAGIRLGLSSEVAVHEAAGELLEAQRDEGTGRMRVLAQEMRSGYELSFGAVNDPAWGPVVVVSRGGTEIELIDDAVAALAPLTSVEAVDLVTSLRCWPYLARHLRVDGAAEAVGEAFARFSRMVAQLGDRFAMIDLNPVLVGRDGDVTAVDGLLVPTSGRTS